MRINPDKYKMSTVVEPVKVGWTYNKIMMLHGQMPTSTLTPEMLEKLKKR